ncbi:methyl-accepting chemotaxis protein [Salinarimonas chemoclinalis]|uniref:methyl-accepting chemotaxis protein n=1 Tax=Salinarimonas chemoclinalis TaxID=3241599 RepID=UPI0035588BDA
MSIRALGLAVCLAVSVLLTVSLGLVLHGNLRAIEASRQIEEVAAVKAQLGAASAAVSSERGLAQLALTLREPLEPAQAAQIRDVRPRVDAALADLAATVDRVSRIAGRDDLAAAIGHAEERLVGLRATLDEEAALKAFRRSPAADGVVPGYDDLMRTFFDIGALAEPAGAQIPSVVAHGLSMQRLGWEAQAFASRDRTMLLIGAIAKWPLDRLTVEQSQQSFERAEQAVSAIGLLARHPEITQALRTSTAAVADGLGGYSELRGLMLAEAGTGNFPLDADTFAAQADAHLAPALALSEAGATRAVEAARALADEARRDATLAGVGLGLGLVALAVLSWFILLRVSRRLDAMTVLLQRVAAGDHSVDAARYSGRDEIGRLADALEVFKTNAREMEHLRTAQEAERAKAEAERRLALEDIAATLEETIDAAAASLVAAAGEAEAASGALAAAVATTAERSTSAAHHTGESRSVMTGVAAATEELTASLGDVTERVRRAAEVSTEAARSAARTGATVAELSAAASRIEGVTKLIAAIAEQTNLLALNATIEAARAGEAGRGFAVVAAEVKELAGQTGRATEEISAQIAAMQETTKRAVAAVDEIGGVVREIDTISGTIAGAVDQQAGATTEIAERISAAAARTDGIAQDVSDLSRLASEAGGAARRAREATERMRAQADGLAGRVADFLARLRAA